MKRLIAAVLMSLAAISRAGSAPPAGGACAGDCERTYKQYTALFCGAGGVNSDCSAQYAKSYGDFLDRWGHICAHQQAYDFEDKCAVFLSRKDAKAASSLMTESEWAAGGKHSRSFDALLADQTRDLDAYKRGYATALGLYNSLANDVWTKKDFENELRRQTSGTVPDFGTGRKAKLPVGDLIDLYLGDGAKNHLAGDRDSKLTFLKSLEKGHRATDAEMAQYFSPEARRQLDQSAKIKDGLKKGEQAAKTNARLLENGTQAAGADMPAVSGTIVQRPFWRTKEDDAAYAKKLNDEELARQKADEEARNALRAQRGDAGRQNLDQMTANAGQAKAAPVPPPTPEVSAGAVAVLNSLRGQNLSGHDKSGLLFPRTAELLKAHFALQKEPLQGADAGLRAAVDKELERRVRGGGRLPWNLPDMKNFLAEKNLSRPDEDGQHENNGQHANAGKAVPMGAETLTAFNWTAQNPRGAVRVSEFRNKDGQLRMISWAPESNPGLAYDHYIKTMDSHQSFELDKDDYRMPSGKYEVKVAGQQAKIITAANGSLFYVRKNDGTIFISKRNPDGTFNDSFDVSKNVVDAPPAGLTPIYDTEGTEWKTASGDIRRVDWTPASGEDKGSYVRIEGSSGKLMPMRLLSEPGESAYRVIGPATVIFKGPNELEKKVEVPAGKRVDINRSMKTIGTVVDNK